MATSKRIRFVMSCWGSWSIYPIWTIHDNVIIFNHPHLIWQGQFCAVLATGTENRDFPLVKHVDCGRWDNHSCGLLYSLRLLYFWHCISEHLWSLFIDAVAKLCACFRSLEKHSDGSSIICEVAYLSLCFKPVNISCKELLFSLLNHHQVRIIGMDNSTAMFELY